MCKIILNNWEFSVLKSFLRALYLQILSDNPIFFPYIPKIQLIKLSSIALVAKFIKFYYARSFVEIVRYSIIQLRIVAIVAQGTTTTKCFVHLVKFSLFTALYGLFSTKNYRTYFLKIPGDSHCNQLSENMFKVCVYSKNRP